MCDFEEKVKKSITDVLKIPGPQLFKEARIGLAVSGGADSLSLLLALAEIAGRGEKTPLYVITINHNIRPAEESRADADFVLEICKDLRNKGYSIEYELVEFERGQVEQEAEKRGAGIEEAARFLRYAAFEKFIKQHALSALCLAHNKNDQLETILMRFLQGSPVEAAGGIKMSRQAAADGSKGLFIRPLLKISRSEIEAYVKSRGYSWCTDKTNLETDYLRNKIRLKLVPFLDQTFPGWQRALISGAEKAEEDAELIHSCMESFPLLHKTEAKGGEESIEISCRDFSSCSPALQRRLLLSACNMAGEKARIPNQFIKDVLLALKNSNSEGDFSKHFGTIDIIKEKNKLFVKKSSESNTDFVFSDIIEETGTFEFPFGFLDVFNYKEQNGKRFVSVCAGEGSPVENIPLPFCVRNARSGDMVTCADGSEKKVSDVFSSWHVPVSKRSFLPVIQLLDEEKQRIIAILGGFSGYKDWIVKL